MSSSSSSSSKCTFMTADTVLSLFPKGRPLTVEELDGEYQVTMWGWYRFMCRDRKIIQKGQGFNLYRLFGKVVVRWGAFGLHAKEAGAVELVYRNGKVIDELRKHPTDDDILLGLYNKIVHGGCKPGIPFSLARRV